MDNTKLQEMLKSLTATRRKVDRLEQKLRRVRAAITAQQEEIRQRLADPATCLRSGL
jgi:peptidoglycan hydrolase CwlO-like protein